MPTRPTTTQERIGRAVAEQKNGVVIKAKRLVDPEDTLTPAEAKVVRRGEAQLKRGQSKPWRGVKHALAR